MTTNRPHRPPGQIRKRPPRRPIAAPAPPKKKPMGTLGKIITGVSIALVAVLAIGSVLCLILVAPYQRVLIQVGNQTARARYIIQRIVANPNGYDVTGTIQSITSEMIMQQEASTLGIAAVTEQDIDAALKEESKATKEDMTDAEYQKWYKDQYSNTPLNEKLYRDLVRREILYQRVYEALAAQVPLSGSQVHLWVLVATSEADANKAIARIQGGEEFAKVASEVSADTTSKPNGGDLGWLPPELMNGQFTTALSTLEINKLSAPVSFTRQNSTGQNTTAYAVFLVTERDGNRQYTDNALSGLKSKALTTWLSQQATILDVKIRGHRTDTYDSETDTWLNYEAQSLGKKYSSLASTVPEQPTATTTPSGSLEPSVTSTTPPATTATPPDSSSASPTTSTPPTTTTQP